MKYLCLNFLQNFISNLQPPTLLPYYNTMIPNYFVTCSPDPATIDCTVRVSAVCQSTLAICWSPTSTATPPATICCQDCVVHSPSTPVRLLPVLFWPLVLRRTCCQDLIIVISTIVFPLNQVRWQQMIRCLASCGILQYLC